MSKYFRVREYESPIGKPIESALGSKSNTSHKHADYYDAIGTAAALLASHSAASDPHPGYLTPAEGNLAYAPIGKGVTNGDSHDHAGGDGAQIDHGGLGGLSDDDHTQYTKKATLTEQGDIYYASAASTPAALPHGNAGDILQSGGHGANPSWLAGSTYAIAAKGVTNGDSHDHAGGDGAQIAYSGLSGLPTLAATKAAASNEFFTSYTSTTGLFTSARPTWANIDKATSSIADITTRSHTALSDIGTNTHAQIDTHIADTSDPHGASMSISTKLQVPKLYPAADGATAFQILKADYTTVVLNVDTTSSRLGIGTIAPGARIHLSDGVSGGTVNTNAQFALENDANCAIQLMSPNTDTNYFLFTDSDSNTVGWLAYLHGVDSMQFRVNAGTRLTINSAGSLFVSATASNANMTRGITINQDGNDDEILALKSSDVGHPFTDLHEATTFGALKKAHADYGGLRVVGASDNAAALGLELVGLIGSSNPTDTVPGVSLIGAKSSGTTVADLAAAETILKIYNNATLRMTLLGDGKLGLGTETPERAIHVKIASAGVGTTTNANAQLVLENSGNSAIQFLAGDTSTSYVLFGDKDSTTPGWIAYTHSATGASEVINFRVNAGTRMQIDGSGNLGLGGLVAWGTSAAKVIGLSSGTAPSTGPADAAQMWVADYAAGYAGWWKMTETTAQPEVLPGVIIKATTGSPSNPYEGLIEINTFDNKVRMYADAGWRELGTW